MNSDPENFEQLRQLLAVKRYEQPHPRYFNDFSSQVVARIRAGERGGADSFSEWVFQRAPWMENILRALETRPAYAGAFGAAVCALLISGFFYSEGSDTQPLPMGSVASQASVAPFSAVPAVAVNQRFENVSAVSSTNPLSAAPAPSLFDQFQLRLQPEAASFTIPSGQ